MDRAERRSLFSLYFAYFVDYFNWGVSIAFIAVYLSDPSTPFRSFYWSLEFSLGLALAAFPLGELIGSPVLGDLSDWMGRRRILLWGIWGSIGSMCVCLFCLIFGNFTLFLIGQLLAGFFSGKQALAQAAIVEIDGAKGQKLAFLSVLGGISWILGPSLGGQLLEEPFRSYGGLIWPTSVAILIYFISLLTTYFFTPDAPPTSLKRPLNFFVFLKSFKDLISVAWKEKLFFLFTINLLGWYILIVSLSDYLISRFHISNVQIGYFNSYLSLCFTIGGILGTLWVLYCWKAKSILFWALLIGSLGLFLIFNADKIEELWIYLAIPALTEAWIYPAYQTLLSDRTSDTNQGKLFGLIGAVNGICQLFGAAILGGVSSHFSMLIAALLFLFSGSLFPFVIRKKRSRSPSNPLTN